ncbi:MAG: OmpA family protein [Muribaculaceae bacterium]|nr:OmpA family protein [Muribaculaceae bacterium]
MAKNRHILLIAVIIAFLTATLPSCKSVKLSDADDTLARGEFYAASTMYRKIYNKLTKPEERPLRGEVAYKLATCYQRLNRPANAVAAYNNALRYGQKDSMIYLHLGQMLQATGKYQQAIAEYDKYLEWKPEDGVALSGIRGCNIALSSKDAPKSRYIVKQSKLFNSRRSDYAPMYLDKNYDILYYTTTNEKVTGENKSDITGIKNGDIWMAKKNEKGEWQRPTAVEGELNSDADEGIISFSPDGQTMYLTVAKRSETSSTTVEIHTSRRSDATWSAPQKFEILNDTITAVGHPSVSPDGRYLYFTSDMPGGYGGLDIWRINLQDKGGSLENLGPQINTGGDESFPFARTDSLLYFSSNGHSGYGGLDLFKATLNSTGDRWSVDNMGQPINSTGDDFGITFGAGESGFFSSNRGDARGYDHIYSFELPDLKISISGWVVDKDDEPVPNARIRIVGNDGSNQKEIARDDGSFKFKLDRGVKYVMMAGANGYLNQKVEFESDDAEEDAEYGIDFILASISKPSIVENIFYDFDKASLRAESKEALDQLGVMLEDNPNVSIEMSAHTDRKGSDQYNLDLSERRAKSVVDYLVGKGINPNRLTWIGYGKQRPKTVTKRINKEYPQFEEGTELTPEFIDGLSEEDQEAADQINRRTEFQVTAIDTDFDLL